MRDLDPRLHDYQVRAVGHLWDRSVVEGGAGLFMDMGLGKTATVLQALTPDHLPALVLAPKRVADEVWEVEAELWRPDLSVVAATGSPRSRAGKRAQDADVTVMTRDTVGDFGRRTHPYKTVVLDELSGYKNKSTARWKGTRDIIRHASNVWGLTGTPAPNGYHDLFAQVFLLDGGRRLGRTLTYYRDRYFYPIPHPNPMVQTVIGYEIKPGAEDAINHLLEDLCVSMRAEDYLKDLKQPVFNEVATRMPPAAQRAYDAMEQDLVVDLSLVGGPGVVHTAANAAALTNKLRQISAGFMYEDQDATRHTEIHQAKVDAVGEIVSGTGDNVLTFYQYRWERDQILDRVPGSVSIDERGAVAAWNRREIKNLVAHPASAGHGLNLQSGGSTLCYSSLPWPLEEWEQSVGRLARQGQPNAVMVNWVSASPIDRVIFQALQDKASVQDALMRYLRERHLWL